MITPFYTFNDYMPEKCDAKNWSYVVARLTVYNVYDMYFISIIYMY